MASLPTEAALHHFTADDGVELAWHEMGPAGGWPVVLIHGLFSNAFTNWIRYGHAAKLVGQGFRVIMPDLRGHGDSAAPHDPAFYPPDVLAADGFALLRHLGLGDYDLGGYSLGGRTTMRMLVMGAAPRRAVVAGMGLRGVLDTGRRAAFFRDMLRGFGTHPRGSAAWMAEAFLKTTGGDPLALLPLLDSFVDTPEEDLTAIGTPVLVVAGAEDDDNGSAAELAETLPRALYVEIPGNHMSAVLKPELGDAIRSFLSD
ncbi:alpha/beta hydrolase [Sphingomonas oleivorans]|uniref:Alpha/beta hydrolase n=1 Tax=Sphingomonas oleivorans TaxID=1735121 RepID=A0A2T5FTK6_9SPHN|nr:alpha/beta fold hydrolase [Sphingomonas oleivorans]PTQ07394.1 alpha/beta hydrolase [Sphingomonas oleivorans]